jgi:Xaa-Pro aminopeptidase
MAVLDHKNDNRIQRLRQALAEKGLDGLLVSQPENRRYLSGFDGSAGFLLVTPKKAILATDFRYTERARGQAPEYEIFQIKSDMDEWFPELTTGLGLGTLGFEAEHVTLATYRKLTGILDKTKSRLRMLPTDGLVESLRAIKEPAELELIIRASEITDRAVEYIQDKIEVGVRENELAWELEKFLRQQSGEGLAFEVMVASGPNAALPHFNPSPRAISNGEPVVIDIGARQGGYCSDLSRTLWAGEADEELKKVYDIVLGAQLTALAVIKEGMTGDEADSLARTVIEEAGYGDAFGHSLGHGVGLAAHELPRLGPKSEDRLVEGMVFTVEPGIYLTGWGGVRVEDVAVMEGGKPRVITKARKVYHDR